MSAVRPFIPGTVAAKTDTKEAMREERTARTRRRLMRLDPKPGDILLFYGPERGRSRLICWFTRSRFYHVGIYAGDGKVIEARMPRVVCRDLYDCDGCRFVVIRAPQNTGEVALAWARERITGHAYDTRGVVQLALRRMLPFLHLAPRPDNVFVCGSFVVRAFQHAGANLFPARDGDHIAPCDLQDYYLATPTLRYERGCVYQTVPTTEYKPDLSRNVHASTRRDRLSLLRWRA